MVTQVVVAIAIVILAVGVSAVLRRRRSIDAPTQRTFAVPEQLDRSDFVRPDAPWLVAVFTSATCATCASVAEKAKVLESDEVAVAEVEFNADRRVHERYRIEAVPSIVIVDADGVMQRSFVGPVSATDLWAAVADVRDPGAVPEGCHDHGTGTGQGLDRSAPAQPERASSDTSD